MNSIFKKISLPVKLILLGTIPLASLLVMTMELNREKKEKLEMIDIYRKRIDQSVAMNALIDNLQTERRYSFGFALKGAWQNEMLMQRERTNASLAKVTEEHGKELQGFSNFTFLDQLKTIRKGIDQNVMKPMEIMSYYTNSIVRLSSINNVAAGNVLYLSDVNPELRGQKLLSEIITYHGIIRGQVYYMLETGERNAALINQANQQYDIVLSYIREFMLRSSDQSKQEFAAIQNAEDYRITMGILEEMKNSGSLDTSMASERWWDLSASMIDRQKALQKTMVNRVKAGTDRIYEYEKKLKTQTLVFIIVLLLLLTFFIYYVIRSITDTLFHLRDEAAKIAAGKTNIDVGYIPNDVIGALKKSILEIDTTNREVSEAATRIGRGEFEVAITPRSEDDIISNAILKMKEDLQQFTKENKNKIWIQTGLSAINDSIRGDKDIQMLSRDALDALVGYMNCDTGLLFISDEDGLNYSAGYAVASEDAVPDLIKFGETLIGQAALKNEIVYRQNVNDEFLRIRSGLTDASASHLLIIPLTHNNIVEGVIELASHSEITNEKMELAKHAAHDIAIAILAAKNRERTQMLLEETQSQSEELQTQHEELENINAELEAQAQKLQASEEELRVQQEELMQANQELEERSKLLEEKNQLIVERNLDIQQKAEELEISSKYKSEFLANMSHELRTPLNSILLLARLLSENHQKNLSGEQVEFAQVIHSSGQGLLSLIDEILDLSKIEAGKMELEYADVAIETIVSDMQQMFAPVAKEKAVDFSISIADDVPAQINTDKLRVEQVIKNLLSNALKFTSKGSVKMEVRKLKDADFVAFSVIDTGIGIKKDKLGLIFEAFQQADGSTRRKYGGTGLGLSISRELSRLLGGEIKVTSEENKGSEFSFYVPVQKPKESEPALPVAEKKEVAVENAHKEKEVKNFRSSNIPAGVPDDRAHIKRGDRVILIIEDDTSFVKALIDFTRKQGYKAIAAVRGDEGVELAKQFLPIGILLDIQLPVKDGWEVMEELKNDPLTRPIPVHMMSANESKKESLLHGAVDFINKPVALEQMQEVFKKIEHVLNNVSKKVLIIEENPKHAKALAYFLESFNVSSEVSGNVADGINALKKEGVDCVILDMGLPNEKDFHALEIAKKEPGLEDLPIIIFTGKNISKSEESKIRKYADSIVVKTAHSYQRILDEVSLFLHIVDENGTTKNTGAQRKLGALGEVLAGKKILVTDDDVRNIFSLTKSLELHNMKVFTATDGKEALRVLEENPDMDAVLMDIMMPEMDGYEAIKRIRQQPKFRALPIITVTAKAMTGDREKSIQAGASDYISKPIDSDQLISLLRVWLYDRGI